MMDYSGLNWKPITAPKKDTNRKKKFNGIGFRHCDIIENKKVTKKLKIYIEGSLRRVMGWKLSDPIELTTAEDKGVIYGRLFISDSPHARSLGGNDDSKGKPANGYVNYNSPEHVDIPETPSKKIMSCENYEGHKEIGIFFQFPSNDLFSN